MAEHAHRSLVAMGAPCARARFLSQKKMGYVAFRCQWDLTECWGHCGKVTLVPKGKQSALDQDYSGVRFQDTEGLIWSKLS